MKIICDCNKELTTAEEGINGSDFFKCEWCDKCYNVTYSEEKEE